MLSLESDFHAKILARRNQQSFKLFREVFGMWDFMNFQTFTESSVQNQMVEKSHSWRSTITLPKKR